MINKFLKIIKFQYPPEMKEVLCSYENEMLIKYKDIISTKYKSIFERYGYALEIGQEWQYIGKKVCSKERLPFKSGYSCNIYCEVQKDGTMVKIKSEDGECDYYPLFAISKIDAVRFPFSKPPYLLFDNECDIQDFCDEMDYLVDLFTRLQCKSDIRKI